MDGSLERGAGKYTTGRGMFPKKTGLRRME